ncbi:4441_t:CDS:1, partial [Dentiscutata heterogama]
RPGNVSATPLDSILLWSRSIYRGLHCGANFFQIILNANATASLFSLLTKKWVPIFQQPQPLWIYK